MQSLNNKVAVISGGTSGTGARIAELFVSEGAKVVIGGRREEQGRKLAESLGDAVAFARTDVAVEADVKALIEMAARRFGRLDCLVNNVGIPAQRNALQDLDLAAFDLGMAVQVRGTLAGIKHAVPAMARQGAGSIYQHRQHQRFPGRDGRWHRVLGRKAGPVTPAHLDRLAKIAAAERERFARRCPRYRGRLIGTALAQGAALHMLAGSTGVKDLDLVMLFAAIPGERFPEFPRLVKHFDFGSSSLGRQAYDLAAARDNRQRRQWARWAQQYHGRRVDLVKRALPAQPEDDPQEVIGSWPRAGLATGRRSSAFYLARKPVVLVDPPALRGTFIWSGSPKQPG